jgi:hypothetical protein
VDVCACRPRAAAKSADVPQAMNFMGFFICAVSEVWAGSPRALCAIACGPAWRCQTAAPPPRSRYGPTLGEKTDTSLGPIPIGRRCA